MKKCAIDGCDKSSHARGFCGTHYKRWQVNGDPLMVREKNLAGLGKGKIVNCLICNNQFVSRSNKTTVCSTECRFTLYSSSIFTDACFEWTGPVNNQGYAVLSLNDQTNTGIKRVVSGHRYSYEKHIGKIPEGMVVMHSCDNPSCVNPKHLSLGTWADNNKDRSSKGRSGSRVFSAEQKEKYSLMFRGSGSPTAKLTEELAKEIKYDRSLGCNRASTKYGVSPSVIKSIRSGRSWKHI